jgi:hypothetical protein
MWRMALLALWPVGAMADNMPVIVKEVGLIQPVTRYGHDAMGKGTEFGALQMRLDLCVTCGSIKEKDVVFTLPDTRVFEGAVAQHADLDGDGFTEAVIVVETDVSLGASLAIYGAEGKLAATDFIGERNRWLAPVGVGNFDGVHGVEIAYVDRPHLARELVIVRYADGKLTEVARAAGFTNHQFGDRTIAGGVRSCAGRDSMIVASADWSRALDVTLQDGTFVTRDLGAIGGPDDVAGYMACQN